MVNRRKFLTGLSAVMGSSLLAACGGSDNSSLTSPAVSASSGSSASPSGTSIPPASVLIDNSGNKWTIQQGVIYKNGAADTNTYNVVLLLWQNNTIYHANLTSQFYYYTGSGWAPTTDPRTIKPASPDGTSIPPAKSIVDNTNTVWSVQQGVIYKNGVADTSTYSVTLLTWLGGKIYHQGTNDQFYVWLNSRWNACTNPYTNKQNVGFTPGMFYGINGHYDYNMYSPAVLVSILQTLGCKSYRLTYENSQVSLNAIKKIAQAFQSAGLTLLVCLDTKIYDSNGVIWSDENTAYNNAYTNAAAIAQALSPYGVTYYECGNENTRDNNIVYNSACSGTLITDFNNNNWPILRGISRGMIDGIKSIQYNAKCGMNFCVADIAASDMLWFGTQPDGTLNHPTVRWDVTTWHNYEVYGDIFNISQDGDGSVEPHFNLPAYCKAKYGVPFIITEWSASPEVSQSDRATYMTQKMTDYYNNRKAQSIDAIMYYELDSGNTTWGVMTNGVPNPLPYNAMKNFIATHPDN